MIQRIIRCKITLLNTLQPLFLLGIRLWMANVFWVSGVQKFNNWDATILLFTDEHPVPFLPPEAAAVFGTTFELLCPVLLVLGLGARFATLPLLVMTAVIQFTYLDHITHYYWMLLLGMILFFGAGKLSADHLIARKYGAA
ncbi:MAG: DoxX family protein [Alphaproteobacteria bacterium]